MTTKITLYDIADSFRELLARGLDEENGMDSEELASAIEELNATFDEKLDSVSAFLKEQKVLAAGIGEQIKALKARKDAVERKIERLENYVGDCMAIAGKTRYESPTVQLSFRKSVAVEIDDEDQVPGFFKNEETVVKIDKVALKEYLKGGGQIAGAHLVERANLQIK